MVLSFHYALTTQQDPRSNAYLVMGTAHQTVPKVRLHCIHCPLGHILITHSQDSRLEALVPAALDRCKSHTSSRTWATMVRRTVTTLPRITTIFQASTPKPMPPSPGTRHTAAPARAPLILVANSSSLCQTRTTGTAAGVIASASATRPRHTMGRPSHAANAAEVTCSVRRLKTAYPSTTVRTRIKTPPCHHRVREQRALVRPYIRVCLSRTALRSIAMKTIPLSTPAALHVTVHPLSALTLGVAAPAQVRALGPVPLAQTSPATTMNVLRRPHPGDRSAFGTVRMSAQGASGTALARMRFEHQPLLGCI